MSKSGEHRICTGETDKLSLMPGIVLTMHGRVKKDKHADKRMKAARGSSGKAIVAGVRDRAISRVAARVAPDTTSCSLVGMVSDHTQREMPVPTDRNDLLVSSGP